jgi:hypothetical protein
LIFCNLSRFILD